MSFQEPAASPDPAGVALLLRLGTVHHRTRGAPGCEVAPCPEPVAVPGCPAWLLGVVVHEGEALPLVDLAAALDEDAAGSRREARRMLVNRGGGVAVAFAVDDVDADDGRDGAVALDLDALSRALLARAAGWAVP